MTKRIDDTMGRPIGHDQNEDGVGSGTTSDVGELKKRKFQNPTRPAQRIHMHHSLVPAGSVQRPPQLSFQGLTVHGSG